jgi:formylglycine-generating enzyme required for sulfatase activity
MSKPIENPPGTVKLDLDKYIDRTEITNRAWIEYMIHVKLEFGVNSNEYKSTLPDNAIWKKVYLNDFTPTIIKNDNLDFPIIGINYEQAVEYCNWRTRLVNQKYKSHYVIEYRLPTESEFSDAMKLERELSYKHFDTKLNLYRVPSKNKSRGIVNLSMNVSEMTDEVGKAFGGNYINDSQNIKSYVSLEKWLGFRCIAELKATK